MADQVSATSAPATTEADGRGRGCGCWIAVLAVLVLGGLATAFLGATFALRQNQPTEVEATLADVGLRTVMVPPEYGDWRMPADIANNSAAATAGGKLFEVECSMCHGSGGKGPEPGSMGAAMFPPAVALNRDRTQSKSDGQLFYLIWHGINYTGMPAWGNDNDKSKVRNGPHTQAEVWSLVAYIRSLK